MTKTKLFHFHVQDGHGNKRTLLVYRQERFVRYTLYIGTADSGMGYAISNIICFGDPLPLAFQKNETVAALKARLIKALNKSTHKVIDEI